MANGEAQTLRQGLRQTLALQCIAAVALLVVVAAWLAATGARHATQSSVTVWPALGAVFYGSLLALAGTLLNARSVIRAFGRDADRRGWSALGPIYAGLLNKLVVIGGGIAFGLIYLGLRPLQVVTGYLVVQMAGAFVLLRQRTRPGESRIPGRG